jgi:hypothetical protein
MCTSKKVAEVLLPSIFGFFTVQLSFSMTEPNPDPFGYEIICVIRTGAGSKNNIGSRYGFGYGLKLM